MDIHKLDKPALIAHIEQLSKKVNDQELKIRRLFDYYGDIFFRSLPNGNIIFVSPSSKMVLGYDPGELIGKNITNYYLYSINTKKLLRQLIRHKQVDDLEISIIHISGKIVPASGNVKLVFEDGWFIEGVVKDISKIVHTREELERATKIAERSMKVKEEFLSNMSHEIRTPLNGIVGMVNVLHNSQLDVEQKKQVNAIKESSDILLKLLNNILDWSKLDAGKMEVKLNAVSPVGLMKKVQIVYDQKALEKKLKLNLSVNNNVPEFILTDELKIIQVLSNLISNAIKFTPEGGKVDVNLSLEVKRGRNILLRGEVRDTGLGIEKKDQEKLFASFTQLDSSNRKKHEGAGLGLSISKEIINLLGGEIGVSSEIGKGSIFWFTFISQIAEREQDEVTKVIQQPMLENSPNILLVDDNQINLEVAGQILKKAGARVTMASSGPQSLSLMKDQKFDIVLLDIQMPEMDGVEVFDWMKSNLITIPPVIALTAYSGLEDREKFLSIGFEDFLGKPLSPAELTGKVREFTNRQDLIIDHRVLDKLEHFGGKKMVSNALEEFCSETEAQIKECFVLLSDNNHKGILDILHALKGNAGTLGANRVARKARQLEEQLKKGYVSRLTDEISSLEYYFNEFKVHYKEH